MYERLPAIDVFAGLTELGALEQTQPVRGLPDREEYEEWVSEQEDMEKEMEFFDKGVLSVNSVSNVH